MNLKAEKEPKLWNASFCPEAGRPLVEAGHAGSWEQPAFPPSVHELRTALLHHQAHTSTQGALATRPEPH